MRAPDPLPALSHQPFTQPVFSIRTLLNVMHVTDGRKCLFAVGSTCLGIVAHKVGVFDRCDYHYKKLTTAAIERRISAVGGERSVSLLLDTMRFELDRTFALLGATDIGTLGLHNVMPISDFGEANCEPGSARGNTLKLVNEWRVLTSCLSRMNGQSVVDIRLSREPVLQDRWLHMRL